MGDQLTHQQLGAVFTHAGVAQAYAHRPPYPPEVFDILAGLVTDEPRAVLDLGAGEGALARSLAPRVDRVDAVDASAAMVEVGRRRTGGDHPNLRWIVGPAETVEIGDAYALVTAGASLHWMDWEQTLGRIRRVLTPEGKLVLVYHGPRDQPWEDEIVTVIKRHSRSQDYVPRFHLATALQDRDLFTLAETVETAPLIFRQSVPDYIEQFHSTSSLAREVMSEEEAAQFDREIEAVVAPYVRDGMLDLTIVAELNWGRPR
ncbi:MAG TPA: methyltransferase domain-containing protein [Mycobacteriales bacterium]|nr:methyltransferase domain-containing protein [Mycobacteriales bacterium]